MNYIIHLNSAFARFCEDDRLTPFHVSLYYTLFQFWNMARFRSPMSINRSELMRASKIGSVNTYIRCMKQLESWQYLQYIPSYNPLKGSLVNIYSFDNSNNNSKNNSLNNGIDISNHKSNSKAAAQAKVKGSETVLIPSTNKSNKSNKQNGSKGKHNSRTSKIKSKAPTILAHNPSRETAKKKVPRAAPKIGQGPAAIKQVPSNSDVVQFFKSKSWPLIEAEKFYNHYSSNGWLVGGKTPMIDWQAASVKWMLNAVEFKNSALSNKSGAELNIAFSSKNKKYDEPL